MLHGEEAMWNGERMGRKQIVVALVIAELTCGLVAAASAEPRFAPTATMALPSEGDCKYVYDSGEKVFTVDHHVYSVETGKHVNGGKPRAGEMILAGGNRYVNYMGKWQKSPLDLEEGKKLAQEQRRKAKSTCHYLRDESVGAETAQVYSMRTEVDEDVSDHTIWISKSRGLYLRQESDMGVTGGDTDKFHISARYEYTNVHTPQM
jgi:hypothetical protein